MVKNAFVEITDMTDTVPLLKQNVLMTAAAIKVINVEAPSDYLRMT